MLRKTALQLALLSVLSAPAFGQGKELYRYTNDEGVTVIDYRVPASAAGRGYEIINERGVVLQVVPRVLTAEELANQSEQDREAANAAAQAEQLRQWDESLLLRYSSIEDIEAARERALRNLRIRVSILRSNVRALKQQVENVQAEAADLERSGKEVDSARLTAIDDLRAEIAATERQIADREQEIETVSQEYQRDMDRFEKLLDFVKLRQRYIAPS